MLNKETQIVYYRPYENLYCNRCIHSRELGEEDLFCHGTPCPYIIECLSFKEKEVKHE